ncbi:MAG TPA: hypothetical protein VGG77_06365 [Roseiarcus sp.]
MTPPASPRPPVDVERAETPAIDAELLITSYRVRAYAEARQRQRRASAPDAAAHWGQVANLIVRRAGEPRDDESSTRKELDAKVADRARDLGVRPAVGFFRVDPLEELERVLAARPQRFRLQFFGVGVDLGPTLLTETEIQAPDASVAIREAAATIWPPRAVSLRLLDLEGREIFERLKADLR